MQMSDKNEVTKEEALSMIIDGMAFLMKMSPEDILTTLITAEDKQGQQIFLSFVGGMHSYIESKVTEMFSLSEESPSKYDN